MENFRTLKFKKILAIGVILITPLFSSAYEPETTHKAITQEIIKFFNHYHKNLALSADDAKTVIQGSFDEDDGIRALRHFYDPINAKGLVLGGAEFLAAKYWSQDTLAQASVEPVINQRMYGSIYNFFSSKSDFSWDRAVYEYAWGNKERGLKTLGHILHLIEDMAVPDHTRNDAHPPFVNAVFHQSSPYEHFSGKWNLENIVVASELITQKQVPYYCNHLNSCFDSMALYSNNNFFSKDTILKDYEFPKIYNEKEELIEGREYVFGYNNKDSIRLVNINKKFGGVNEYSIVDDRFLVLASYWSHLSQQAVLHGAGAVKLFFDEVEKERETKLLYNKNKNWFRKLFDNTEKDIYQTATALYGGTVPYDELNEDDNTQQINAVTVQIAEELTEAPLQGTPVEITTEPVLNISPANSPDLKVGFFNTDATTTNNVNPNAYQPGFGGGGGRAVIQQPEEEATSLPAEEEATPPPASLSAPAPVILSPEPGFLTASNTITFSGIASSTLVVSNNFNSATTTPDENENWTFTFSDFPEGTTIVQFLAADTDNATTSEAVSREITVDTVAPSVDSFTVMECSYSLTASICLSGGTTLNLLWTSASTDISYTSLIKNDEIIATTTDSNGTIAVSSNGTYNIQIAFYDTAGNGATSTAQSVEVLTQPIVINEIAWAGTSASAFDEWIELYNHSPYDINLSNVLLTAHDGAPSIQLSGIATTSSFYLIERTDDTTTSVAADLAVPFSGEDSSGLSNDGEVLFLNHILGGLATTTLDETPALAECAGAWCAGNLTGHTSMERVNQSISGSQSSNWKSNNTFTKNGTDIDGNAINGTPRAQNSASLLSIGYYCSEYTSSFTEGGYYAPLVSAVCTYLSPDFSGLRYGDIYRGVIASSTLVNGHSLSTSATSTPQNSDIQNPTDGEQLFTAIYMVRTGPAFQNPSDVTLFRGFFETGANPPPNLNYGVLNWRYGVGP